jgi:phosphoribosylformimino-5-aminoimidazole carboxamide ribotide isomerase
MQVWPAIDLLDGKCVRLQQGDYDRNTVFGDSADTVAQRWFDEGAECLHCVDLDAARSGDITNEAAIREIVAAASGRPVQLGGGVRSEAAIERLLGLGLTRLVVGTAALKEPDWFATMCDRYPGALVLGVDARDGFVATEGWLESSTVSAAELIAQIEDKTENIVAIVYTDIAKDGMMSGPNFESLAEIISMARTPVIASGGVTTLDDIRKLASAKTPACIIGRSLYENAVSLPDVLEAAKS